jgi:predicted deacetylase
MKLKESIRIIEMIAGISIGIFVASRFAVSSSKMAVLAASHYIQELISFK